MKKVGKCRAGRVVGEREEGEMKVKEKEEREVGRKRDEDAG